MVTWSKRHFVDVVAWTAAAAVVGVVAASFVSHAPLKASATDRQEGMVICTGMLEDGIEAVFILDSLTGDLKGTAISPRTGKFMAAYQTNVVKDMQIDISKNPRFCMVSGAASLQRQAGGGNVAPGDSVVYVAELTTGKIIAYAVPIQQGSLTSGRPMAGNFLPLDMSTFRQAVVRDTK